MFLYIKVPRETFCVIIMFHVEHEYNKYDIELVYELKPIGLLAN
ncbi:hypothetical protein FHS70_004835 [Flammeovirga yaeyamensis]|nr:hypothetical protein [Flammeovirga yaeyamensis]